MKIKYVCPFWGSSHLSAKEFITKALDAGYDGVEVNMPGNENFVSKLRETIDETGCAFIAQQWLPPANETVDEYRQRMLSSLKRLADLNPLFINSHTGKDFFSFQENCSLIESCNKFSAETGVKIVHETHRGRFNFHTYSTLPYLEKFRDLELNADFSHFCNVSESLLEDQEPVLEKIIKHCHYIHARVGFNQSAQVNHPFAPEWKANLEQFTIWWQKIIDLAKERGEKVFYVCPEFGPFPYIQQLPFTKENTVDQWKVNVDMMEYLKLNLKV